MKKYNQLSVEHRHKIQALMWAGHNQSDIARHLEVHRSNNSRELDCNILDRAPGGKNYRAKAAQPLTDQRHRAKPKHRRFTKKLKAQAHRWLTPDKLYRAYQRPLAGKRDRWSFHKTFYQWIWAAKRMGDPEVKDL